MAQNEPGLFKTKRSKFFLLTVVSSGLAYYGMKYMRNNKPENYQRLIWGPIHKSLYPVLLTITVLKEY
jgi:hypothetical protein